MNAPLPDFMNRTNSQNSSRFAGTEIRSRRVIDLGLGGAMRPIVTTNFRPGAVVLLHLLQQRRPDIPVVWIDTGYNTAATYRYIDRLVSDWNLDLRVYSSRITAAHRAARGKGIPKARSERFARFVDEVKIEPFQRALNELKPDTWFTGIRREQSDFRARSQTFSQGSTGRLKIAPMLDWRESDIRTYIDTHDLVDNESYLDVTKPGDTLECGIQFVS